MDLNPGVNSFPNCVNYRGRNLPRGRWLNLDHLLPQKTDCQERIAARKHWLRNRRDATSLGRTPRSGPPTSRKYHLIFTHSQKHRRLQCPNYLVHEPDFSTLPVYAPHWFFLRAGGPVVGIVAQQVDRASLARIRDTFRRFAPKLVSWIQRGCLPSRSLWRTSQQDPQQGRVIKNFYREMFQRKRMVATWRRSLSLD